MKLHNTIRKMKVIYKYLKIYLVYIICMVMAIALCVIVNTLTSGINASFEMDSANEMEVDEGVRTGINYNYFLDFSPSMQGFLYERLASGMKDVAEAFRQINAGNENNYFYWCIDNIEPVEAKDFYESMESEELMINYYERIVRNNTFSAEIDTEGLVESDETTNSELERIIANINLTNIFTVINSKETGLNVIVSDLNFLRDAGDGEGHNERLSQFASELGNEVTNRNICIYAVDSNYLGISNDVFTLTRDGNINSMIYIIIFSDNDAVFTQYCQQFENIVGTEQIYEKFELLRRIDTGMTKLKMDLNEFTGLDLVTIENLNFANGMFENLKENELALQLVTSGTTQAVLTLPVSEIKLSGYYSVDTIGMDDTKINIETELYQSVIRPFKSDRYEKYDDVSAVLHESAGIYYDSILMNDVGHWYLRVNMTISTHPKVPEQNTWYQRQLEKIRRRYMVMNIKFYMAEPSFSKPEWISTVSYPNMENEDMKNIEDIIDEVILYKERAYASLPDEERYLGNTVVYILY